MAGSKEHRGRGGKGHHPWSHCGWKQRSQVGDLVVGAIISIISEGGKGAPVHLATCTHTHTHTHVNYTGGLPVGGAMGVTPPAAELLTLPTFGRMVWSCHQGGHPHWYECQYQHQHQQA